MNVIFLTMAPISDIEVHELYPDLMRFFVEKGHNLFIVSPRERRLGIKTYMHGKDSVYYLGVKTLNLQKTNVIEKGLGQILVESQFKRAIRNYWQDINFDIILYATPPITIEGVVKFLKRINPEAISYLMLKDIFPQNAIDLGLMSSTGIRGLLYRYFRKKEKRLYSLSDYIGCMSPANVQYILRENPEINRNKVEVAPNSVELNNQVTGPEERIKERHIVRSKYNLPEDVPIFIYGGNLGQPQGIPFLIECLKANSMREDCHFVIVGNGTELPKLLNWKEVYKPRSSTILRGLPKKDYDELVRACDVGIICLDHRFTIPNYPSRILSYLENKMPVICVTDPNTDIGRIAEENGYGYWCESDSVDAFTSILDRMIHSDRVSMGECGYKYLCDHYLVENTYNAIISHV